MTFCEQGEAGQFFAALCVELNCLNIQMKQQDEYL